jgi:hypothetical protein
MAAFKRVFAFISFSTLSWRDSRRGSEYEETKGDTGALIIATPSTLKDAKPGVECRLRGPVHPIRPATLTESCLYILERAPEVNGTVSSSMLISFLSPLPARADILQSLLKSYSHFGLQLQEPIVTIGPSRDIPYLSCVRWPRKTRHREPKEAVQPVRRRFRRLGLQGCEGIASGGVRQVVGGNDALADSA